MNVSTRLSLLVAVLVALTVLATAQSPTAPPKPQWPNEFDAPFGLNVDSLLFHIHNRSSHFYYDWDLRSTRIAYPNGCLPYITEKPCDLIFNDVGLYLLSPQDDKPCCLLLSGIGSVPPDFLAPFNFADIDFVTDMYNATHECAHWKGPEGFEYWTDLQSGDDVRFQDGDLTGITWAYGTINYVNQSASTFQLPSQCSSSCLFSDGRTPLAEMMPPHLLHPYMKLSMAHRDLRRKRNVRLH